MHALIEYDCGCYHQLLVCKLLEPMMFHAGQHETRSALTLLGVYPTERIANKVRDHLIKSHIDVGYTVEYMRKHTPPTRMSRREAKRTRATIAAALEIIDDEAQRRKDMPF